MKFKQRLGKVFLCVVLGFAAFGGAYMRPDEIEDLMDTMHRPRVAYTLSLPDAEGGEDAVQDVVRGGGPGDCVDGP
jgi:hypothetical protein